MRITVLIPAYNAFSTIRLAIDSVLSQTVPPDEILVIDDGSTDQTAAILDSYRPAISVFRQENKGVAHTRNLLCAHATGDLVAFLDADDLWHPRYLEVQRQLFQQHPDAVAFFTGHINFRGFGGHQWSNNDSFGEVKAERIRPVDFFRRYNQATGPFASMSYCCVPKRALAAIGSEPFCVNSVEDSYFLYLLALSGSVIYTPEVLAAYRIHRGSLSANHVKTFGVWVSAFELLEDPYRKTAEAQLFSAFQTAFASKRRSYAKLLLHAGRTTEAREQIRRSLSNTRNFVSLAKSIALLSMSFLPGPVRSKFVQPPSNREA
jgi:glycosyltransferase involved in cell wall biosynthesis